MDILQKVPGGVVVNNFSRNTTNGQWTISITKLRESDFFSDFDLGVFFNEQHSHSQEQGKVQKCTP